MVSKAICKGLLQLPSNIIFAAIAAGILTVLDIALYPFGSPYATRLTSRIS